MFRRFQFLGFLFLVGLFFQCQWTNNPTEGTSSDIKALASISVPEEISCANIPDGLESWWDATTTEDLMPTERHGVLNGDAHIKTGFAGNSFYFDGRGDYIEIQNTQDYHLDSALTIEAWMYLETPTYYPGVLAKGNMITKDEAYGMFLNGRGLLGFLVNRDGSRYGRTMLIGPDIPPYTWVHVAASFADETISIYLNGVKHAVKRHYGGINPTTKSLMIGIFEKDSDPSTTGTFYGMLDEISLYSRALSDAEIFSLYNAGSLTKCEDQLTVPTPLDNPIETTEQLEAAEEYIETELATAVQELEAELEVSLSELEQQMDEATTIEEQQALQQEIVDAKQDTQSQIVQVHQEYIDIKQEIKREYQEFKTSQKKK